MATQRLTPLDAAFLRMEDSHTSLHIASIAIFDGPPPTYLEIATLFEAKLPALPRYRQKIQEAALWLSAPVWVDDPHFLLSNHLRHSAVPRPGDREQLNDLVGRLMSQRLDRSRPLWESWLIEGLEDDHWALINKVHHCMVDGIGGTDLLSAVLDGSPSEPSPRPGHWAQAAPGRRLPARPYRAVAQLARSVQHPRACALGAVTRLRGMAHFTELVRPATRSSLSGPLGAARCWRGAAVTLEDVRVIRDGLGGTVNDVVLALATRGYRDLLLSRGEAVSERTVRTLVPVSVRTSSQRDATDNRITAMVAELPSQLADPLDRLQAIRAELTRLKHSGEPEAGVFVTEFAKFVPPVLVNAGLAGLFRIPQRFVITVATNVPGPAGSLYAAGRQLAELYPYVPIADQVRVGVAITSYRGVLYFGVTGDRDSSADIAVLTDAIEDEVHVLRQAAVASRDPRTGAAEPSFGVGPAAPVVGAVALTHADVVVLGAVVDLAQ
jgi:WS/DGAT/MGAT family acyltransferase